MFSDTFIRVVTSGPFLGFVLAAVVAGGLIFAAWSQDLEPRRVNISILIAGGVIGWTAGILLTPVTNKELLQFGEFGKVVSTFITGYLAAKIDRLFDATITSSGPTSTVVKGFMLFIAAFFLGALSTIVWRSYVTP